MKKEVLKVLTSNMLTKLPLLKSVCGKEDPLLASSFLDALSKRIESLIVGPKDTILIRGEIQNCAYLIRSGSVEVTVDSPETSGKAKVIATLGAGQVFNDPCFLSEYQSLVQYSASEEQFCGLFVLWRADLDAVLKDYPTFKEQVDAKREYTRKKRIAKIRKRIFSALSKYSAQQAGRNDSDRSAGKNDPRAIPRGSRNFPGMNTLYGSDAFAEVNSPTHTAIAEAEPPEHLLLPKSHMDSTERDGRTSEDNKFLTVTPQPGMSINFANMQGKNISHMLMEQVLENKQEEMGMQDAEKREKELITLLSEATQRSDSNPRKTSSRVISSRSPRKLWWDFTCGIFTLYYCIIVLYRWGVGFDDSETAFTPFLPRTGATHVVSTQMYILWTIDVLLNCFFVFDIVLRAVLFAEFTGDLTREQVFASYKRRIMVDILATLPLDVCVFFTSPHIASWLRFNRLIRLVYIRKYLHPVEMVLEAKRINPMVVRIFKQFIILFLTTHWLTCLWYTIGKWEGLRGVANNWTSFTSHTPLVGNPDTRGQRYVTSLYFVFVTMSTVGYGDIRPRTFEETVFALVCMLCGTIIYSSVTANLASIFGNMDLNADIFRQNLDGVKAFMKREKMDPVFRSHVEGYYRGLWNSYKGVEENTVVKYLPFSLRHEVCEDIHRPVLEKTDLFKGLYRPFVRSLVFYLRDRLVPSGANILQKGDVVSHLVIMRDGVGLAVGGSQETKEYTFNSGDVLNADIVVPAACLITKGLHAVGDAPASKAVAQKGKSWGDMLADAGRPHRQAFSIRAIGRCDVLVVDIQHLTAVLQRYPSVKHMLLARVKGKGRGQGLMSTTGARRATITKHSALQDDDRWTISTSSGFYFFWMTLLFVTLCYYLFCMPLFLVLAENARTGGFWAFMAVLYLVRHSIEF